jgi:hypothetical protein
MRMAPAFAGLLAIGLTIAACSPPTTSPSAATSAPSATPVASRSPAPSGTIAIDPSLLAVLPENVQGLPFAESPEADADASANRTLADLGEAAVGAVAVDQATNDLLVVLVVRLKTGAMTDAGFRSWRDSYDAGACGAAGIIGNAEGRFGSHLAYIGTCGGPRGLRTYHTWVPEQRLLISASSIGTRRLAEALIASLRVPPS